MTSHLACFYPFHNTFGVEGSTEAETVREFTALEPTINTM
jgi:hypothetical protein